MIKESNRFNYNYLSVVFLYIVSVVFMVSALQLKNKGSMIVPISVSLFSIAMATLLFLRTKRDQKHGKEEEFEFSGTGRALKMGFMMLLYVFFTATAGFYLATPVYLVASMIMLGSKNKKTIILVSILTPFVIWIFFDYVLGLRVPKGFLFS